MKNKNYRLPLLVIGLVALLAQISAFTLNQYYELSGFTSSVVFSVIAGLLCCFFILVQPKEYGKFISISLVVYGAVNMLYALTRNNDIYPSVPRSSSVFETLLVVLTHVSFLIAMLFLLLQIFKGINCRFTFI